MTWELHHGDALAVLRELPTASVDALITDPPYSSGGFVRGDRMASTGSKYSSAEVAPTADFTGDNRDQRSFLTWMNLWLHESQRVLKPGAVASRSATKRAVSIVRVSRTLTAGGATRTPTRRPAT